MEGCDITCSVCAKTLRNPVQLPCFHSFCQLCVCDISETVSKPNCNVCPFCRCIVKPLGTNGSILFPKDTFLERYISSVKIVMDIKERCDICDLKTDNFCIDCSSSLCVQCQNDHVTSDKTQHHQAPGIPSVLELVFEQKRKLMTVCNTHGEDILFYCMTCSTLACMTCILEDHKKHWSLSVSEALKLKAESVKHTCIKLKAYHSNTHALAEANLNFHKHQISKLKEETKALFDSLVETIRQKESQILKEIDTVGNHLLEESLEDIKTKQQTCMAASSVYGRLKLINRYGSETDMLDHYSKVRASEMWSEVVAPSVKGIKKVQITQNCVNEEVASLLAGIAVKSVETKGDHVKAVLKPFVPKNTKNECTPVSSNTNSTFENASDSDVDLTM